MDEKVSSSTRPWPAARAGGRDVKTSEPSDRMLEPRVEMTFGLGASRATNLLTCAKMAGISVERLETFSKLAIG